ncbi:MAG: hypothetical protein PHE21_03750 [Candidatus Dojkabacteria bacterium]|nr:hypothetical protein [Candidatus Dojkabacteria bacterium]
MLEYKLREPFKSYKSLEILSGVENLNGSEHFTYIQIKGLNSIGKVLEQYEKLISDNLANINVEPLSYKL